MNKFHSFLQHFGGALIVGAIILSSAGWYLIEFFNNKAPNLPPAALSPTTSAAASNSTTSDNTQNQKLSGVVYSYTDAIKHLDENTAIRGTIVRVFTSKSGTIFLDYCKEYATCPFSAVIFGADTTKFSNVIKTYQNKATIANGFIRAYNGQAEMVISDPSQIQLVK